MCYVRQNRSNYVFIHWDGSNSTDVVRLLRLSWNNIVVLNVLLRIYGPARIHANVWTYLCVTLAEDVRMCVLIGLPAFSDLFVWLLRGVQLRLNLQQKHAHIERHRKHTRKRTQFIVILLMLCCYLASCLSSSFRFDDFYVSSS